MWLVFMYIQSCKLDTYRVNVATFKGHVCVRDPAALAQREFTTTRQTTTISHKHSDGSILRPIPNADDIPLR